MLDINRYMQKPKPPEPDLVELIYALTDDDLYKLSGTIAGLIEGRKQSKKKEEQLSAVYERQERLGNLEHMRPLSVAEAARILGVSDSTVRELSRRDLAIGGIRCEKVGRRTIIRQSYIDEWIETNKKSK